MNAISHSALCDVEVIAVALCPPGMMCKLDCLWLNPFSFVSLGGWLLPVGGSWFLLICTETVGNRGGGGGGVVRLLTSSPQECASVLYQDFALKLDLILFYRLSDLVNCFELLCGIGGYDVWLICRG